MAYAALLLVARRYTQGRMWDQLEAQLTRPAAPQRQQRPTAPTQPGGFVSTW
jgi:hypothetical protein